MGTTLAVDLFVSVDGWAGSDGRGREAAFADVRSADLERVAHRGLDARIVLLEYRPTGRDIPRA